MTRQTINKPTKCPNESKHTHEPPGMGYVQWHEWAQMKGETHYQVRCPDCKLLVIWKPKWQQ